MTDAEDTFDYEPDLEPIMRAALDVIHAMEYVVFMSPEEEDFDMAHYDECLDRFAYPVCGCDGCSAREITLGIFPLCVQAALDAMVQHNVEPDKAPCCVVAKRAWRYHVALLDIATEDVDPKKRALEALEMIKEDS